MNPKISIIVPVYNVQSYIHECLDSILNQTFTDFELILVNDGSTDCSGNICEEYAILDSRIQVISKNNGGLSSARNAGLDIARGDFIGFVDSDDWINNDMYEVLYKNAILNSSEISVCDMALMKKDGRFVKYNKDEFDVLFTRDEAMEELYSNCKINFSSCNKIFKRELFNMYRYKEGIILEDMDISYHLVYQTSKLYYTYEPMYQYRYNEDSILRSKFNLKRIDEYFVRERMYKFYSECYPRISDLVYSNLHFSALRLYTDILGYNKNIIHRYDYLIKADKVILNKLIKRPKYPLKNKVRIVIFLLSPYLSIILESLYLNLKLKVNKFFIKAK